MTDRTFAAENSLYNPRSGWRQLVHSLFGPFDEDSRVTSRASLLQAAFWLLIAGLLFAWRTRETLTHPQFWAEDGPVFLLGAIRNGLAAFGKSYGGYFHLLPRLIAWLSTRGDPAWVPAGFVYLSFGFTLLVLSRIFSRRFPLGGKPWLALAVIAVPHSGEVYLSPTNLQWIAAFGLLVVLLSDDPRSRWERVVDFSVIALVGLSGPFSVFLAPLFLLRGLHRKTVASWGVATAVVVIAALQSWEIYFHSPPLPANHPHTPFDLFNAMVVVSERIPIALLGGTRWVHLVSPAAATCTGVVFFGLLGWTVWANQQHRRRRAQIAAFFVLLLLVTVVRNRMDTWPHAEMNLADRYLFVPKVLVLWLLASAVDRRTLPGRVAATMLVAVWLSAISVWPLAPQPRHDWSPIGEKLKAGESVQIEINPGWKLTLPPADGWR